MLSMARGFVRDQAGTAGIEYALIVSLISVAVWTCGAGLVETALARTADRALQAMAPSGPSWSLSVDCSSRNLGDPMSDQNEAARRCRGR
jgi:Flp pilus assembly pilin Flp